MPSLLRRVAKPGLILLSLGRPEEAAMALNLASERAQEADAPLTRHRALALIASSRPEEALDAIGDQELEEKALALVASGRPSEAYRFLALSMKQPGAGILAILSGELEQDAILRDMEEIEKIKTRAFKLVSTRGRIEMVFPDCESYTGHDRRKCIDRRSGDDRRY